MKREYTARIGSREFSVTNVAIIGDTINFEIFGNAYAVSLEERSRHVSSGSLISGASQPVRTHAAPPRPQLSANSNPKSLVAPISGVVVSLHAKIGETVTHGQIIAVLEAMKMENPIKSDRAGVIKAIHIQAGGQVRTGEPIISFE